jgi:hypothetical protein
MVTDDSWGKKCLCSGKKKCLCGYKETNEQNELFEI